MTISLTRAKNGPRACGAGRQAGHIYAECGFPPHVPVEQFLTDLPIPINSAHLGLVPQGVSLIEQNGVFHIIDIVGASHYPEPSDFIEEARRLGVSRKIPRTTEFEKLTRDSTLILIHPKAFLKNPQALAPYLSAPLVCPTGKGHAAHEPCAGWYTHLATAEETQGGLHRRIPAGRYPVTPLNDGHPDIERGEAIFMQVPISNLAVITGPTGHADPKSMSTAQRSALPVFKADY